MKPVLLILAGTPAFFRVIFISCLLPSFSFKVDKSVAVKETTHLDNSASHGSLLQPLAAMDGGKRPQPSAEAGMELFAKKGCVACHAVADAEAEGKLGPQMKGLFGSVRDFEDGKRAVADENYIRQSILAPTDKVVKGFQPVMPPYGTILTPDEVESVVLYIKSL